MINYGEGLSPKQAGMKTRSLREQKRQKIKAYKASLPASIATQKRMKTRASNKRWKKNMALYLPDAPPKTMEKWWLPKC